MTQAGYEKLGDEGLSHTSPAKDTGMLSAPPPPKANNVLLQCAFGLRNQSSNQWLKIV